jgi:hypothetical protein
MLYTDSPHATGSHTSTGQYQALIVTLARRDCTRRPVDWRYQRVQLLFEQHKRPSRRYDDEHVVTALHHFRALAACCHKRRAKAVLPGISAAHEAFVEDRIRRWAMEAWLLAGAPIATVADKAEVSQDTVCWYNRLFFDVADRLDAPGFIVHEAIGGKIHYGLTPQDVGVVWKRLGYWLGGLVLDVAMADFKAAGGTDYSYVYTTSDESLPELWRGVRLSILALLLTPAQVRRWLRRVVEFVGAREGQDGRLAGPIDAMTEALRSMWSEGNHEACDPVEDDRRERPVAESLDDEVKGAA